MRERKVGIRELKSKLSECVRDVKMGATIVVTDHGRSVARIVPEGHSLGERLDTLGIQHGLAHELDVAHGKFVAWLAPVKICGAGWVLGSMPPTQLEPVCMCVCVC